MPKIGWYLNKVAAGEPVNPKQLAAAWKKTGNSLSTLQAILQLNARQGEAIEIVDATGFKRICGLYGADRDLTNRFTAARTGDSHAVPVSKNFLLTRSEEYPYPVVVLMSDSGHTCPRALSSTALIVENLALFMAMEKTLAFFRLHTEVPPDTIELIFGGGRGVNAAKSYRFLSTFTTTYWVADLDYAGLDIVGSAIAAVGTSRASMLVPNNLEQFLATNGHAMSEHERNQLTLLGRKYPAFQSVIDVMLKAGKLLEQEAYLATL